MAHLWPLSGDLYLHDVCDAIDLWISHCGSPILFSQLNLIASAEPNADIRRHYEQWVQGKIQKDETFNRPYFRHLTAVEVGLTKLPASSAFAFGSACVERFWPIYQRASAGKSWNRQTVFRENLDAVWSFVRDQVPLSEDAERSSEAAILEEDVSSSAWAARDAMVSLFCLIQIIRRQKPGDCRHVAKENLSFLDAFLYKLTGLKICKSNDLVIDNHELMQTEIARQTSDLELLRQPLTPDLLQDVRNRSAGKSILGEYWYR
jgi:hypothetical protein